MAKYEELPERYKEYCKDFLTGYKKITKKTRKNCINKFLAYLVTKNLELENVNLKEALAYKKWLLDQNNYTPFYRDNLIKGIRVFYKYLIQKGIVKDNPFCSLTIKENEEKIKEKYRYVAEFLMGYSRIVKMTKRMWLMKLMRYLEDKDIPVETVGEKEAKEYKTWIKEQKHYALASITDCIKTVVHFYYYLKEQGIIHKNPFTRCDKKMYVKPEVLKEYEEEARQRGLRKRTIASYSESIKIYLNYLAFHGLTVEEIKASSAMAYLKFLVDEKKFTKGVIAYNHEAIKSFYDFLYRKKVVLSNPFKGIKQIKTNKKIPRNLPKEKEMDEILEATKEFTKGTKYQKIRRYKFHVIAELMYATGMRINEVSKLKEEDINFDKGIILIRDGKGGKSRTAILNDYAKEILKIYVKMRPLLHDNNYKRGDSLFGLSSCHLIIMVNEELKRFGNYTSHFFRHSVGYHLLKAGCDIRYIQEILGHENIKQTEIYTKVDKEDLLNIIDKYHPRQWHENK